MKINSKDMNFDADIIKNNFLFIFGHCEMSFKTSCLGVLFFGKDRWKIN